MDTYALIIMKPDALERELVEKILSRFIEKGFKIELVGYKKVTEGLILAHYSEVIEKLGDWFRELIIKDFVGKDMIPVILSQDGINAVENARFLTGATDPIKADKGTIRGDFGIDSMEAANHENRSCFNLIHCSDSIETFVSECKLWFDDQTIKGFVVGK
ncbi:MAG: nucleoside-diphosphate kinase [Eubacteriaceae bacterium]|jgi:nucleoside-diphosphate kinase|nr:nucleoside-diphosphate kinase [Eubacteriaceae bacterium]MDK2904287.1 nucleoside-diphosphate kinase [Eubacteriaceae bacterium]MDK2937678.1 nucleoside-diphosphate kinase [Eubacteriaceae bacterium]MDK2960954.1 nucleoside-diphosphate kinase [Eubacteriaceae bacterium]MDN5306681.1 nucleoside-diphosphate kinase [Eubacteriaceae bacterium]